MECTNENGFLCITTPTTERQTTPITKFIHLKDGDPNSVIIGVDEQGNPQSRTIDELTHLLVAGTTGSGKSVCLNSIIMGLCCYNNPKDLGIILIDPKVVYGIFSNQVFGFSNNMFLNSPLIDGTILTWWFVGIVIIFISIIVAIVYEAITLKWHDQSLYKAYCACTNYFMNANKKEDNLQKQYDNKK